MVSASKLAGKMQSLRQVLQREPFWRPKKAPKSFSAGVPPQTPLGELTMLPDPLVPFSNPLGAFGLIRPFYCFLFELIFSERELMFMFAICRRPSVCLSSVTFVHPTQPMKFSAMFLRHVIRWWPDNIQVKFYGHRPRGTPPSGGKPEW